MTATWESSLDGTLALDPTPDASGTVLDFATLSEGEHALVLSGTDTVGNTTSDSVTIVVGPPNSKPTCEILAPQDDSAGEEGAVVQFEGLATDADIASDLLAVAWSSDKDGSLGNSTPSSSGEVVFSFSGLSPDTHAITMTVTDEVGATCTDLISYTVGTAPTIALTSPTTGSSVKLGDFISFSAEVSDADEAPTKLSLTWESSIDGVFSTQGADSTGVALFQDATLSEGTHGLTVTVTDSAGLYASAIGNFQVVANAAPSIASVSIDPDPTYVTSSLTCTYSGFNDPDGDPDASTIQWKIGGSVVGTGATLASNFAKGDAVKCVVTPSDGTDEGSKVTATRTISNSVPSLSNVTISPSAPVVGDTLSCSYAGFDDPDGDTDSSTMEWFINGSSAGSSTTLASGFSGGDTVECTVTPNDGEDDGAPVTGSITIENTLPTVTDVTISPDPAYATDSLSCSYTFDDADGDSDASSMEWFINGVSAGAGSTLAGGYAKGDEVECTVTPNDGLANGTPDSGSVTIANSVPSISDVTISPSAPVVGDTLSCSYAGFDDPDSDPDSSTLEWFINGSSAGSSPTLSSGFSGGDTVECTVTPKDGEDDGVPVTGSITIENTLPTALDITISPDPAYVTDSLSCSYTFDDADGDSDASVMEWFIDGASAGSGSTLIGGFAKGQEVECTVTPNDGIADGTPDSGSVTIANTLPVASGVSITPSAPTVSDTLTCSYAYFDADGDADESTIAWTDASGTSLGAGPSLSGAFSDGDVVTCTVTPTDDEDSGSPVSADVTIGNSAPSVSSVSISPNPATELDLLTAVPTGWDDPDGDPEDYAYAWTVDGSPAGGDMVTLDASYTAVGSVVTVTITPWDGYAYGSPVTSAPLTIGDSCVPGQAWSQVNRLCVADYQFVGEEAHDFAGYSLASAGDVDGDGLDDLLVSAHRNDDSGSTAGKTYLMFAASLGGNTTIDLDQADYAFTGEFGIDYSGISVAGGGDVDGDGKADLLIGANQNDEAGVNAGKVYLILGGNLGATTTMALSQADYAFTGQSAYEKAGFSVSFAGDVDDDGLDDILIGAFASNENAYQSGRAYLVLSGNLGSPGTIDLANSDYIFDGEASNDQAGYSVASAGDVDDDGLADLLIGAPQNSEFAVYGGKSYLILGASLGSSSAISLAQADYTFIGESDFDNAGQAVSSAGDIDGDGRDDILIGAPSSDNAGTNSGTAYVVLASSLTSPTIALSNADYTFDGESSFDSAGTGVASAGDVDGDGLKDNFIGANTTGIGGTSYLVLGGSLGATGTRSLATADYIFEGEATSDDAARAVASAGDIDGDGLDDLFIGAHNHDEGGDNAGTAYLLFSQFAANDGDNDGVVAAYDCDDSDPTLGHVDDDEDCDGVVNYLDCDDNDPTSTTVATDPDCDGLLDWGGASGTLSAADYAFVGETANDLAGIAVSSAGDVDGDNLDDLLVGAYLNDEGGSAAGKVYLILGASLGSTPVIDLSDADYAFVGEEAGDSAGIAVSSAGDVDDDGLDDILVGAYKNGEGGTDAGKAYLILGSSLGSNSTIDLSLADYAFVGEAPSDLAGNVVSSAGDVDDDGLDDILVGSPWNGDGGVTAGKAYLILGSSLTSVSTLNLAAADYAFVGEAAGDVAGRALALAGDVDDDGLSDLLIGASNNDDGGTDAGKAYLILGASLGAVTTMNLADADYAFVGEEAGDAAGRAVAGAGDVDGDGLDDVLLGPSKMMTAAQAQVKGMWCSPRALGRRQRSICRRPTMRLLAKKLGTRPVCPSLVWGMLMGTALATC